MQEFNNKRLLVSPLDWGLGHTTRCITIIRRLIDNGCVVIVACNATQKKILQQEFPSLEFLHLEGYNISYSKHRLLFPLKLIMQLPKIVLAIRREHTWLQKTISEHKIDLVISDNRYGQYHNKVPSVIITHQLLIKAPFTSLEWMLQQINYSYLNKFSQCWVPDFDGSNNIAGAMSHPKQLPAVPVTYIGPLARFAKSNAVKDKQYDYCIILSGPEPQRTILEDKLLLEIPQCHARFILVRGKPNAAELKPITHVTIKNHLAGTALQAVIESSEYVITRSGYTSVMELLALEKKSILIPTPGQTEQEYLAQQLMQQGWAYCNNQQAFHLQTDLAKAALFNYQLPTNISSDVEQVITQQMDKLFSQII